MKHFLPILLLVLTGCVYTPPGNVDDICEIFREKGGWYDDAKASYEKWGVPVHLQLAIIHQESGFKYNARTKMQYVLWIIPIGRQSTAFGFPQAKDATWDDYIRSTGNTGADRDDFDDAVDFIGWYGRRSYDLLGISKWDAYNQYLAYHEGHAGYERKTYDRKPWLIKVAKRVSTRASLYHTQLSRCEEELDSGWWFW